MDSQDRARLQDYHNKAEQGRKAREFLNSPMYLELLQPLKEQEERRLLEALKALDTMDKDQLLTGALAIKAGLEAAGAHERHLLALAEEGENAQTQINQLVEELELEKTDDF